MAVRETLDKIEYLVSGASHLPLTGKVIIDEEKLTQMIEEFRNELPQELGKAEEVLREREEILRAAQQESEQIIRHAEQRAIQLVDENDVVTKAREKARVIETQANQKSNEIIASARNQARQYQEAVHQYANQVFDQLMANVTNTLNSIQATENNLKQATQVLQQSKNAMNQQTYAQSQNQQMAEYNPNPQS